MSVISRLTTSHPCDAKLLPTDPVPANSSRRTPRVEPKWPREGGGLQRRARRGEGADPLDPRRSPRGADPLGSPRIPADRIGVRDLAGRRRLATGRGAWARGLAFCWGSAASSESGSEGKAKAAAPSESESEGSGGNTDMARRLPHKLDRQNEMKLNRSDAAAARHEADAADTMWLHQGVAASRHVDLE